MAADASGAVSMERTRARIPGLGRDALAGSRRTRCSLCDSTGRKHQSWPDVCETGSVNPVDITAWEPAGDEALGTKPKQWVRSPAGELWLWKRSTVQMDARHGRYRKGDDWSEVLARLVGEALGIPVAHVELAQRATEAGVISRSVLADRHEVLAHGNELLSEALIGSGVPHDRTGYTVRAVAAILERRAAPMPSGTLQDAFDWFAGYLVLDALVGNTDRHQDNWATIRSPSGERLAPSFDHASCLGFQLSDAERVERVAGTTNRTVDSYAAAARTKFERRPSPIDAAVEALTLTSGPAQSHWIRAVDTAADLTDLVDEIPDHPPGRTGPTVCRGALPSQSWLAVTRPS